MTVFFFGNADRGRRASSAAERKLLVERECLLGACVRIVCMGSVGMYRERGIFLMMNTMTCVCVCLCVGPR